MALLCPRLAAERLNVKVATLKKWRQGGRGPAYVKVEGAIRYHTDDLDAFVEANRVIPVASA